jgi:hypothetical protein
MNNDLPASGAHVRRRFGLSYLRDSSRNVAAGSRLYRQCLAFLDRENVHDAEQVLPALDMAVPFLDDSAAVATLPKFGQGTLRRARLHFPNASSLAHVTGPDAPRSFCIRSLAASRPTPRRLAISENVKYSPSIRHLSAGRAPRRLLSRVLSCAFMLFFSPSLDPVLDMNSQSRQ